MVTVAHLFVLLMTVEQKSVKRVKKYPLIRKLKGIGDFNVFLKMTHLNVSEAQALSKTHKLYFSKIHVTP